jgi:hypothetical protein
MEHLDTHTIVNQVEDDQKSRLLDLSLNIMWEPDDDYHYINSRRTEYYPPHLLFNPAHVGLFTRLTVPQKLCTQLQDDLREVALQQSSFHFNFVQAPVLWRKCVAIPIQSDKLHSLRSKLNKKYASLLMSM